MSVNYKSMKNYTDLNIILDRSGSMSSIATDMTGGIETFLAKEKATGDETRVSLFQFDDKYETVFENRDIKDDIKIPLTPRGGTALLDAVGKTIASVGEKLAAMKEADRPNRVLFLVITDGEENSSREFSFSSVKEKLKHQRENYAWDFVFLGTNEDALFQGEGLGIGKGSTRGFARTSESVMHLFSDVSANYQMYKSLDRSNLQSRASTFEMNPTVEQKVVSEAAADLQNTTLISK
jgi:uncharacterized protein YegL